MTPDTLDVAVLLNAHTVERWQTRALRGLLEVCDARLDLVLVDGRDPEGADGPWLRERLQRPWLAYRTVQSIIEPSERLAALRATRRLDDHAMFSDAVRREVTPVAADGLGNELPADAVDRLGDCDVAVRFGFGILVGDALSAPGNGVLSYHHGDLTKYRGQPAGFWEFIRGEPRAGVTLQPHRDARRG